MEETIQVPPTDVTGQLEYIRCLAFRSQTRRYHRDQLSFRPCRPG